MNVTKCRIKGYIQPFERTLALKELEAVSGSPAKAQLGRKDVALEYSVQTEVPAESLLNRLAYWEAISDGSGTSTTTLQSLREATVNVVRNGTDLAKLKEILPFGTEVPLPNRRCLRYGTHGIHEYRGKFFPQLVRSLLNVAGAGDGALIADPMSGSATTAVEAKLFGCKGLGLDMNPLSSFIGKTKCDLLDADPAKLEDAYIRIRDAICARDKRSSQDLPYFNSLADDDRDYLLRWFAEEVLHGLDRIAVLIKLETYAPARDLMWIALSNVLRSVSWQKNDDLRVRKDIRLDVDIDPKKEFLEEMGRSVRAVLAFLYQEPRQTLQKHHVTVGDARDCAEVWSDFSGAVDVIITSPPYATALPYLDTDRLSLCYLGLLSRPAHRKRDLLMIGNREITDRWRREYWDQFLDSDDPLPTNINDLIHNIEKLNRDTDAGFRRKNLPSLLAKYFTDMREVFSSAYKLLKPGGYFFVVVGSNHTIAGGERIEIDTPALLSELADVVGFNSEPPLAMELLVSRDIFRRNAMAKEEILFLQKPG